MPRWQAKKLWCGDRGYPSALKIGGIQGTNSCEDQHDQGYLPKQMQNKLSHMRNNCAASLYIISTSWPVCH